VDNDQLTDTDRLYARVVLQTVTTSSYTAWIAVAFYTTTVVLLATASYVLFLSDSVEGRAIPIVLLALSVVILYRLVAAGRLLRRQRGILTNLRDAGVYDEMVPEDVKEIESFDEFARMLREKHADNQTEDSL
jgi:hypothetical protein